MESIPGNSDDGLNEVVGLKLSDLIREGSKSTTKVCGWGNGEDTACALTAAEVELKRRGYR